MKHLLFIVVLLSGLHVQSQDGSQDSKTKVSVETEPAGTKTVTTNVGEEEKDSHETLFKKAKVTGFYFATNTSGVKLKDGWSAWTGGSVALTFNDKVSIGFSGRGLVSEVFSEKLGRDSQQLNLISGYGGLLIEPILFNDKLIHVTFPVVIGGGAYQLSERFWWDDYDFDDEFHFHQEARPYLVINPGVNAELNVTKWFRVAAGVNYLWTEDFRDNQSRTQELSGFGGNASLKFGWF